VKLAKKTGIKIFLYSVAAVKEEFSVNKIKETNLSKKEEKKFATDWEAQELQYFFRDLRPKSFRELKQDLDKCLESGINLITIYIFDCFLFKFLKQKKIANTFLL